MLKNLGEDFTHFQLTFEYEATPSAFRSAQVEHGYTIYPPSLHQQGLGLPERNLIGPESFDLLFFSPTENGAS